MRPTEDFWRFFGIGLMFFFIAIGIGSCMFLGSVTHVSLPS